MEKFKYMPLSYLSVIDIIKKSLNMNSKIRFFAVLMFFCLISLDTANAYTAYINIYITDLDTNTASESDPIKLVDNAASPIQWKLTGTGCSPTDYTDDITAGEYGNGDTITTGSTATLTEGSSCTLTLQVDEVKVGSYYYGSCATDTTSSLCTTCANVGDSCQVHGESTQYSEQYSTQYSEQYSTQYSTYTSTSYGAPTNGYLYSYLYSYSYSWSYSWSQSYSYSWSNSYWQSSDSAGDTGNCGQDQDFGRCSDEIQDQIYAAQTTEFSWGFTA